MGSDRPWACIRRLEDIPRSCHPQNVITTAGLVPDPVVLGQHINVPSPTGSGLSPKWDFTSSGGTAGNPNAYAVVAKVGDLPSPDPTVNVDNVMLKVIKSDLASEIFRVQDHRGQPSAECNAQSITVKYTVQYWHFGGKVTAHDLASSTCEL